MPRTRVARLYRYQDCVIEAWPYEGGVHRFWVQPIDSGLPFGVRVYPWTSTFTICMLEE